MVKIFFFWGDNFYEPLLINNILPIIKIKRLYSKVIPAFIENIIKNINSKESTSPVWNI
jgi:hypothetical protein